MIIKVPSVVPASILIFIAIIFVFPSSIVTISSFAQSDSNNNSTNQTMENMSQSANQKQINMSNKMPIKQMKQFKEMLVMVNLTSLKKPRT